VRPATSLPIIFRDFSRFSVNKWHGFVFARIRVDEEHDRNKLAETPISAWRISTMDHYCLIESMLAV
jgi:hypothetical protein